MQSVETEVLVFNGYGYKALGSLLDTCLVNGYFSLRSTTCGSLRLDRLDEVHAINDFAKYDMLAVKLSEPLAYSQVKETGSIPMGSERS